MTRGRQLTVGVVEDYELIMLGLRDMLAGYSERFTLVELDADSDVDHLDQLVDVVLVDPQGSSRRAETLGRLLHGQPRARVVVYSWDSDATSVERAVRAGVHGYLSKALRAAELVEALEAIHSGELVIEGPSPVLGPEVLHGADSLVTISEREADVLRLIMEGRSNAEVAEEARLSANTVKSYIRSLYRKIGVSTRPQAVLWGLDHVLTASSARRPATPARVRPTRRDARTTVSPSNGSP